VCARSAAWQSRRCLTSTATQHGGQETTLFSIITNLLHFGMVIVGLDYGHAGQPTANELQGARYQGRKIAETAQKLHGTQELRR
jgi:NAD(P)H dehydrogenase (quinone)